MSNYDVVVDWRNGRALRFPIPPSRTAGVARRGPGTIRPGHSRSSSYGESCHAGWPISSIRRTCRFYRKPTDCGTIWRQRRAMDQATITGIVEAVRYPERR